MKSFDEDSDRHVVPRWRRSGDAINSPELLPIHRQEQPKFDHASDLSIKKSDFYDDPNIGTAADLIGTAIVGGRESEAIQAARFILEHADDAPRPLLRLSKSLLDVSPAIPQNVTLSTHLAHLRRLILLNPHSAALWADMARCQAINGQDEKAERSMKVAMQLAPNSRWVLRSSVRLLLHNGHKEAAHSILARNPRTPFDPWLLASEVATAQVIGHASKFWRRANNMVKSQMDPIHLSELASAIATVEMSDGNTKLARRLFRQSLISPTENAVAQVKWAEFHIDEGFNINEIVKQMPDAYEASFWQKYYDGQMEDSLVAANLWLVDEPFSIRPVAMKCYVACLLDDYDTAIRTNIEFRASGDDDLALTNNRVCAEISKGDIFSDEREVIRVFNYIKRRILAKEVDYAQSLANMGLLQYRLGSYEDGKVMYDSAVQYAINNREHKTSAGAAVFHAREALLAGVQWAGESLNIAKGRAVIAKSVQIDFYLRKVEAASKTPHLAPEIFNPGSAGRFESKLAKDVRRILRIQRTESGDIIWVPRLLK